MFVTSGRLGQGMAAVARINAATMALNDMVKVSQMASNRLNVECLDIKVASGNDVSIPSQLSGIPVSVAEVRSEAPIKRMGRPISHTDCGKWLDEGTVPHRVGAPHPNVLPKRNIGRISENIGDCSDDTCKGEAAGLLTLHGLVYSLPTSGDTRSTPHTTGLTGQQVTR